MEYVEEDSAHAEGPDCRERLHKLEWVGGVG